MTSDTILVMLLVGLLAGWFAGLIVRGTGFGLIGDIAIGVIGAFIGNWLLRQLGVHLGSGLVGAVVTATIGAVVLLLLVGLLRRRNPWYGGGWGRRWGVWGRRRFW